MKRLLILLPVFLISLLCAAFLSMKLPYIENWPHTGISYGIVWILLLALFVANKKKQLISQISDFTPSMLVHTAIAYFLVASAFCSFTFRFLTEPQQSYSFDNAVILLKQRSYNHNYPNIKVKTDDGRIISLDIPGQDKFWQKLKIGDRVNKNFNNAEIHPRFIKPSQ